MKNYKIITVIPEGQADKFRQAIGEAGAGKIGKYDFCSFTTRGIGRSRPLAGANPTIGTVGKIEEIEEEKVEFVVTEDILKHVLSEIKRVHPYEEPATEVYEMVEI